MLSAVILAKEGLKVCVLEKDKQVGGCLQTFSLHKTVFDSCVHYIGGLGEGHTLHRIFRYAGIMEQLKLKAFDENGFDRICFEEDEHLYPHATGFSNFTEQLLTYFPGEKDALNRYIDLVKQTGDHFPLYRLRSGYAAEKNAVSGWSLTEVLQAVTDNPLLRNVLAGNNLLYAGEAGKTPFYLHALVLESYMHSAHKVMPGSSQIAKFLWQQLQAHGGIVYRNAEVKDLIEEDGKLTCAATSDGRLFYGKQFIGNVHPAVLTGMLRSSMIRPAYRNRIKGLQQTISSFMLNLVLAPGAVPLRNYNLYWHRRQDVWSAVHYRHEDWPANYALYYTASRTHPGFAESVSVLTYMKYEEVGQWQHTHNHTGHEEDRGDAYRAFKQERSDKLLQQVYQRVPELKGNVIAQSSATPLTYRDYTATPEGSLYGILKDVNKPAETTIATRTRIPNLLLTGQNVNLHGVLGVSITAVATCAELVGMEYLLKKIQ